MLNLIFSQIQELLAKYSFIKTTSPEKEKKINFENEC